MRDIAGEREVRTAIERYGGSEGGESDDKGAGGELHDGC